MAKKSLRRASKRVLREYAKADVQSDILDSFRNIEAEKMRTSKQLPKGTLLLTENRVVAARKAFLDHLAKVQPNASIPLMMISELDAFKSAILAALRTRPDGSIAAEVLVPAHSLFNGLERYDVIPESTTISKKKKRKK